MGAPGAVAGLGQLFLLLGGEQFRVRGSLWAVGGFVAAMLVTLVLLMGFGLTDDGPK
ncbi:hypothetical protein [Streptomyces fagopyri]|uniref:hypothetical protein n=1 Tax=Streptomyces fagopyri TaxID=2662397 RepID=UPI0037234A97